MQTSIETVPLKHKLWMAAGCAVFCAAVVFPVKAWAKHHHISLERLAEGCLPWRAYIVDTENIRTDRYDLVLFPSKGMQPLLDDGKPIGKMVLGVAGDTVDIKDGRLSINGQYIANLSYGSQSFDKPKNHWDKSYTIPVGKIFVFGTEKRSWDSRYWGLYDVAAVRGNMRPLF